MMYWRSGLLAAALAVLPRSPVTGHRSPPSLVVLVVVDQMRADYLQRFASQWTGGFARIYRGGTVFEHGEQDHAATETAPGHATLLSGRYPAHTGIVLNSRGVQDPEAPLIGHGRGEGASPHRFRGTTLVDWMLARDPATRVLSVSRKDRGAIFPVGRAKVPVYWFDAGAFTTSRYYADSLPAWVQAFNQRGSVDRLAGATWDLLLPDSAYAEPDSEPFENSGADYTFPHRFPAARDAAVARVARFPWMDSLTLAFALEGVRALGLGRRPGPDLLSISLSTTDAVGHAFGPDSREIHDQLLHVDRWLGQFLDSLDRVIGSDRVVVVLTGDHGVTPIPEYNVTVRHRRAGRVSLGPVARGASIALRERIDRDFGLDFDSGLLLADVTQLEASGIDVDSLAQALASEAARLPGVAHVYTPRTLAAAPPSDRSAELWRRLLPVDYGWLLCAVTTDGYVWSGGGLGAEHSSANWEDIEVPIAFYGPGIAAQRVERPASTVDIAPTLAALLGISPTEPLDGRVLREVVKARVSTRE
ncbi:MAG TPA: alkaline phosphatase family protein [Gemmatimonadales bacterium]|nr:alkaline phosphatase family protein [Gemmatimonadales bacterium]